MDVSREMGGGTRYSGGESGGNCTIKLGGCGRIGEATYDARGGARSDHRSETVREVLTEGKNMKEVEQTWLSITCRAREETGRNLKIEKR